MIRDALIGCIIYPMEMGRRDFFQNLPTSFAYLLRGFVVMLDLAATALNLALKEWAKGTGQPPTRHYRSPRGKKLCPGLRKIK